MKIYNAISELILSRPNNEAGGFVIFEGNNENDFVQYSLEENGLSLYWPSSQEGLGSRLPEVMGILSALGIKKEKPSSEIRDIANFIQSLKPGTMFMAEDGVYVQGGRNVKLITDMTCYILREVFDFNDPEKVTITLELY